MVVLTGCNTSVEIRQGFFAHPLDPICPRDELGHANRVYMECFVVENLFRVPSEEHAPCLTSREMVGR